MDRRRGSGENDRGLPKSARRADKACQGDGGAADVVIRKVDVATRRRLSGRRRRSRDTREIVIAKLLAATASARDLNLPSIPILGTLLCC